MKKKIKKIVLLSIATAWSLLNLIPLFMVIISAFKNSSEIYLGPFVLPSSFYLTNFATAFSRSNVLNGIMNSFIYSILSVIIILVLALMAGYILSRYDGKLVKFIYIFFVIGILVPVQATFIPLVSTVGRLGAHNKVITMVVIYVTFNLSLSILLITGYMKCIPREIDEAARIDGCGVFASFVKIIAPLAMPAASTAGILAFINIYNDLIFANLFISRAERQTVTQVISGFSSQYTSDVGATFAALCIAILPIILIFILFQEKVISGLSSGALKG